VIEQPSSLTRFGAKKLLSVNELHSFNYVLRLAVSLVALSEVHSHPGPQNVDMLKMELAFVNRYPCVYIRVLFCTLAY
jgi:hypothetical protein